MQFCKKRSVNPWIIYLAVIFLYTSVVVVCIALLLHQIHQNEILQERLHHVIRSKRDVNSDPNIDYSCTIQSKKEEQLSEQEICITKDCTETAATLIASMDRLVDPCEDFFKFSCGGFIKKNPVPDDKLMTSAEGVFEALYKRQLRDLVEETDFLKEPKIVFIMQEAYHMCLNISFQLDKEIEGFKRFLQKELYGWPLINQESNIFNQSIEHFWGGLIRQGFKTPFIKVYIYSDYFGNPKDFITYIAKYNLDLSNKQKFLEGIATVLGDDIRMSVNPEEFNISMLQAVKSNLRKSKFFHRENLEISQESERTKVNIGTLMEVTKKKFNWIEFLNTIFKDIRTFTEEDKVIVNLEYISALGDVLENVDHEALIRYSLDVAVLQTAMRITYELDYLFMNKNESTKDTKRRSALCMSWIQRMFPLVLTRLFVKKHLDVNTKEEADKLVHLVVESYRKIIEESVWLDHETKEAAVKKANLMGRQVAYPDFVLDDEEIEKYYSELSFVHSTHFENVFHFYNGRFINSLKYVNKQFNEKEFFDDPLPINAHYDRSKNVATLQMGFLQLPYFDVNRIAAVNYGMTGVAMGHEIGHGFDDDGREYNEVGLKRPWWTNKTEKIFLEKSQCFINQYSSYCPEELEGENICVKGNVTLGENLADSTGLKAAYFAYMQWLNNTSEELRLPGLQEYTPQQIFFISYAHSWCENIPPFNWLRRYSHDVHSPGRYRVNGVLANSEEFVQAFGCKVGPMNRGDEKCTVW